MALRDRKTSKHNLFLGCIPTVESRLANPVDFIKLQSLCVGEGITPDSGAVPLAPDSKDADSVSTGLSVRDFLETVAEKIRVEEAVYDKFFCALSDVLGQDASQVVLQEASYPVTADETANGHDTDTDASEVSSPLEDEERGDDVNVAFLGLLDDSVDPINAVSQPVGAMALGGRDVLRRRDNATPYDIHSAENLQNASRTAQHEQQTRRRLESDLSSKITPSKDFDLLSYEKQRVFQELERLSGRQEVEREKHRCRVTKLQNSIAAREVEVSNLRKTCQECEELIESQSEKINSLSAQISKTNSLQRDLASRTKKIQDLEERKAEFQNALEAKSLELNRLTAERDESIQSFHRSTTVADNKIAQCEEKIEELIGQLLRERDKCSLQTKKIAELRMINRLQMIEHLFRRKNNCFIATGFVVAVCFLFLYVFLS